MKVHTEQKLEKLRDLRNTGYSITEIVKLLSMPKTTVWHHVQKIKVPEKYTKLLQAKQGGSRNRSEQEWEKARAQAKSLIKKITNVEKLLIATCLYWAEGSKGDFCLTNTDPVLIKTFLHCLNEFGVKRENISISLRLYEDIDINQARSFWSGVADVKPKEIKSISILSGKKNGKLPYGMCRIRLRKGGTQFKLIQALRERLVVSLRI